MMHDIETAPLDELMARAAAKRDAAHGRLVSYSRKVFIPLTKLCRDVCHYCTFAQPPRALAEPYLSVEAVLKIARDGAAAGCKEALFTLGDKPELRYALARRALETLGFRSTIEYLEHCARAVHAHTGLLPHLNPGVMTAADLTRLRPVSVSMGLMLESASERLSLRGGPHFGSPDKLPQPRLATLAAAGALAVPFTTGLLIGIGETRRERLESLLALRALHARHGHLQEIIIQNFRAKPGTKMADAAERLEAPGQRMRTIARRDPNGQAGGNHCGALRTSASVERYRSSVCSAVARQVRPLTASRAREARRRASAGLSSARAMADASASASRGATR